MRQFAASCPLSPPHQIFHCHPFFPPYHSISTRNAAKLETQVSKSSDKPSYTNSINTFTSTPVDRAITTLSRPMYSPSPQGFKHNPKITVPTPTMPSLTLRRLLHITLSTRHRQVLLSSHFTRASLYRKVQSKYTLAHTSSHSSNLISRSGFSSPRQPRPPYQKPTVLACFTSKLIPLNVCIDLSESSELLPKTSNTSSDTLILLRELPE